MRSEDAPRLRTCFIHMGTHKTGTTSIQHFMSRHASALASLGYLYPTVGRLEPLSGHHNVAWRLLDDRRFRVDRGTPDEIVEEIAAADGDVVVSSEDFIRAFVWRFDQFSQFVDRLRAAPMRIVAIVYLRNQLDFLRSNYFERLKGGLWLTFEGYVNRQIEDGNDEFPHDYGCLLSGFGRLPDVEVVVRPYEAVKDSLIEDFLSVIGLKRDELPSGPGHRANETAAIVDSFRLFYRNRVGRAPTETERHVIESLFSVLPMSAVPVSEKLHRRIVDRFSASNAAIAATYGLPAFGIPAAAPPADAPFVLDRLFSAELSYFVETLSTRLSNAGLISS